MRTSKPFVLSLTGVLVLVGFMLTVQISTLSTDKNKPSAADYLTTLGQVTQQEQENKLLNEQISRAEAQLATYQTSGDSAKKRSNALLSDWKTAQQSAGLTAVSGAGITLTIGADPTLPNYKTNIAFFDPQVVLSYIVNLLYSQGATAMSIQGAQGEQQRLVTTSAIRDVINGGLGIGTVVVNSDYPIAAPYTIRAIGDVPRMQAILTAENVAQLLRQSYGVDCVVTPSKNITISPYNGSMPGKYAKEVNGQ